jgi:predicted Zn-ribbon and HTH transcriptional regulator
MWTSRARTQDKARQVEETLTMIHDSKLSRKGGLMEKISCHHCGYVWTPRKEKPVRCAQCQNPLWQSPKPHKIKLRVVAAQPSARASLVESGDEAFDPPVPACRESTAPIQPIDERRAKAEELFSKLKWGKQ